jgi:import receptor subunit TOM22
MSEVSSNSSAEEISAEEIEEIQIAGDDNEMNREEEEDSYNHKPQENKDDEPPIEVMDAPTEPKEDTSSAAAVEPAVAPAPEAAVETAQPEADAAVPAADDVVVTPANVAAPAQPEAVQAVDDAAPAQPEADAAVPAAAENVVILENVADVEEVPRDPLEEPPIARMMGMGAGSSGGLVGFQDDVEEEEDDEDIDETLTERLIGLTEMFPNFVRKGTVSLVKGSWGASQSLYGFSRSAAWIFFSTASILIMPVMIETERLSIMDQQKQQKAQMLLGPGVAGSGAGPSLGPPPI